uniref:ZP domain-containing protein n=1 Tax=Heterorhabditis bacteriophora TaxID=37862 RepID=A0A1I7X6D0_HETBA
MPAACVIRITDENGVTVSENPCGYQRYVSPPPPVTRVAADFFINSKPSSNPLKVNQTNNQKKNSSSATDK